MAELSAAIIGKGKLADEHRKGYERAGVSVIANPREHWEDGCWFEDADMWSIVTPDHMHFEALYFCSQIGVHVFCEKPICQDRWEFEQCRLEYDADPNFHLRFNFPLRLHPPFLEAKALLDAKKFGSIYRVVATYHWGRRQKMLTGWRAEPWYSLWHAAGCHMVDIVQELFDEPLDTINLDSAVERTTAENGKLMRASFFMAGTTYEIVIDGGSDDEHFHRLEVYGDKDNLFLDNREECDKSVLIPGFVEEIRSGIRNERQTQRDFRTWEICEKMKVMAHG